MMVISIYCIKILIIIFIKIKNKGYIAYYENNSSKTFNAEITFKVINLVGVKHDIGWPVKIQVKPTEFEII